MGISRENSVGELPSIERSSVSKANESKRRRGKKKIQDRLSALGAPPSLRKDFSLSFNEPVQPSMSLSLTSDGRAATIMSQFYAAQSSKKDFDTSVKGRESPSKDFDETGGNMKLGNMLSSSMFSHSKKLSAYKNPALFVEPVRMTAAEFRAANGIPPSTVKTKTKTNANTGKKKLYHAYADSEESLGDSIDYAATSDTSVEDYFNNSTLSYSNDTSTFSLGTSTYMALDAQPRNVTSGNIKFVPSMISTAPLAVRPKTSPNSPILARLANSCRGGSIEPVVLQKRLEASPPTTKMTKKKKIRKKKFPRKKCVNVAVAGGGGGGGGGDDGGGGGEGGDRIINNGFDDDDEGDDNGEEEKAAILERKLADHKIRQKNVQMILTQQAMFASFPSLMDESSWKTSFDRREGEGDGEGDGNGDGDGDGDGEGEVDGTVKADATVSSGVGEKEEYGGSREECTESATAVQQALQFREQLLSKLQD